MLLRRHNLLRSLVERLVTSTAVENVVLNLDEKKQAQSNFQQKHGINGDEQIQRIGSKLGLDKAELEILIEQPIKVQKYCQDQFRLKAESHFLTRKDTLDRVVYSLLRVKEHNTARELYFRIAAHEANFADLASKYSEGPEKKTNGIIGPVPMTNAHPQLAERLRTSKQGELLEPFRIGDWWLVTRLENYTPAIFDEDMALQMSHELFESWVKEETESWIARLNSLRSVLDLSDDTRQNNPSGMQAGVTDSSSIIS